MCIVYHKLKTKREPLANEAKVKLGDRSAHSLWKGFLWLHTFCIINKLTLCFAGVLMCFFIFVSYVVLASTFLYMYVHVWLVFTLSVFLWYVTCHTHILNYYDEKSLLFTETKTHISCACPRFYPTQSKRRQIIGETE